MAFRYINPGYGDWIGDSNVTTVENYTYNPEHGVSFQKLASSDYDDNEISLPQAFTTDIYAKFNMYLNSNPPSNFLLGAKSNISSSSALKNSCFGIYFSGLSAYLLAGAGSSATGGVIGSYVSGMQYNSLNTIQFHIHRGEDAASSFGELTINGVTTLLQFSDTNYRQTFGNDKAFFIHFPTSSSSANSTYISELIVSDEEISPKEKIIALPTSETFTDMTTGASGIYIADAVNQTLLQSVDVMALIENYGASSAVTGIAVVGNPAYKTATGLAALTGISKIGETVIEHGTCDLSNDTSASIVDGWATENLSIADLQGMQFGWKAGT